MIVLDSPKLKRVYGSKKQVYLDEPYYLDGYWSESLENFISCYVPKGLIIDGASIPRIVWRTVGHPLMPQFWVAATIHDWLYGCTDLSTFERKLTRKECDLLFYDLLRADKVGKVRAETMYRGVRLGGWTSFRKNDNKYRRMI